MAGPEAREQPRPMKVRIGNVDVAATTLMAATARVWEWISGADGPGRSIHFCNAYTVALAGRDPDYGSVLNRADLVCADGTPVVWAQRWLHDNSAAEYARVYGPDLMEAIFDMCEETKSPAARHYLLGATPATLEALRRRIEEHWPSTQIVGWDSPAFREPTAEELEARDDRIASSVATVVWVGLGTPKQDFEVARIAARLPVVALGVGAAFDFLAGTKRQAPRWMQRSGTEWLYRLATEPRRLAHRYFWGNSRYVGIVLSQRLRGTHDKSARG